MKIHEIHDIHNSYVTDLLKDEFSKIQDPTFFENYHPNYKDRPANIFYILEHTNRYKNGAYYVLENAGQYILSAGWNQYEYDPSIALIITRLYISPKYRRRLLMSEYILPKIIEETKEYFHTYVTVNEYNRNLYNSFIRARNKKVLRHPHIELYRNLVPRGKMNIYFTEQEVLEYSRHENNKTQ